MNFAGENVVFINFLSFPASSIGLSPRAPLCRHGCRRLQAKKAKEEAEAEVSGEEAKTIKPLEIGDPIPDVTLKNEEGEDVKVRELLSGETKGLVLFLVPKADTRKSKSCFLPRCRAFGLDTILVSPCFSCEGC